MKRLHLFEFSDQKWLPVIFRRYLTDLLQFHLNADKTYDVVIPVLNAILKKNKIVQLIDICSGSSGPWKRWMQEKKITADSVILTDKFPQLSLDRIKKLPDGLKIYPHAVDALNVPPSLHGGLTFFTGFHHFKTREALAILKNAVMQKRTICIFEFTERNTLKILSMLFSPLIVLTLTFKIRPLSFARIFWTCIIPVVPLIYLWDGMVSNLRTYTLQELIEMHFPYTNDYHWESARLTASNDYQQVSYLIGYTKAAN